MTYKYILTQQPSKRNCKYVPSGMPYERNVEHPPSKIHRFCTTREPPKCRYPKNCAPVFLSVLKILSNEFTNI